MLPSCLNLSDHAEGITPVADEGTGGFLRFSAYSDDGHMCARADRPIPPNCGLFYFEVNITERNGLTGVSVGIGTKDTSLTTLMGKFPGSYGYGSPGSLHVDGVLVRKGYCSDDVRFGEGDTVGVGVNFQEGTLFFTKNGLFLADYVCRLSSTAEKWYPLVSAYSHKRRVTLQANFGQKPMVFDANVYIGLHESGAFNGLISDDESYCRLPLEQYFDFKSLKMIGRGAFAAVYEAEFGGKTFALKLNDVNDDEKEAKMLKELRHKHIIGLFGTVYGEHSGILMEFAANGSLDRIIEGETVITPEDVFGIAQQMVSVLIFLKGKNVAHRDIKPANVLLMGDGVTIKLCDLGIAAEVQTMMTRDVGTMRWMAPEILTGKNTHYNTQCDVFSFAVVLWGLVQRRKPYDDIFSNVGALKLQICNHSFRPRKIRKQPPAIMDLADLIYKCWRQSPRQRPYPEAIAQELTAIKTKYNLGEMTEIVVVKRARGLPTLDVPTEEFGIASYHSNPKDEVNPHTTVLLTDDYLYNDVELGASYRWTHAAAFAMGLMVAVAIFTALFFNGLL